MPSFPSSASICSFGHSDHLRCQTETTNLWTMHAFFFWFVCLFKPPQRSPREMLVPQVSSVSFASGHTNTYWLHCHSWHAGPMSHAFPCGIHTICPNGLKFLVGSQLWLFSLLFWFPSLELYFALVDSQASFPTQQAALKVLRAPTHCVLHFANKYIWWCYNSK